MLEPFHDEEAEAVRGIPPTPFEHLAEESVTGSFEFPVAGGPSQAGMAPSSTPVMPPPAAAVASGPSTPMDVGDDIGREPEAVYDEHVSKKTRISVVAGVEYEHEDDHNYTSFINAEFDSLEQLGVHFCSN